MFLKREIDIFRTDKSAISRRFIGLNSIQDEVPKCLILLDFKQIPLQILISSANYKEYDFTKNKYTLPLQSSRNHLFICRAFLKCMNKYDPNLTPEVNSHFSNHDLSCADKVTSYLNNVLFLFSFSLFFSSKIKHSMIWKKDWTKRQ